MEFGEEITTNCNYTCSGTLFKCIVSLLNAMHHVCLFQVVCGGIEEEKFSSAKGEKKNLLLLPLNPVQLLQPTDTGRAGFIKHLMVSEEGRYNQQEQMFGGHPSPDRTNEEMFNNREHSNLPDLPTLFRLL